MLLRPDFTKHFLWFDHKCIVMTSLSELTQTFYFLSREQNNPGFQLDNLYRGKKPLQEITSISILVQPSLWARGRERTQTSCVGSRLGGLTGPAWTDRGGGQGSEQHPRPAPPVCPCSAPRTAGLGVAGRGQPCKGSAVRLLWAGCGQPRWLVRGPQ